MVAQPDSSATASASSSPAALARAGGATGLRYPAEDSVYEEPRLRAAHLLPESEPAPPGR